MDGMTADNVAEHLLELTPDPPPSGHVYTLHAELEGMKLAPVFERLLEAGAGQGYDLMSLGDYFDVAAGQEPAAPRSRCRRSARPLAARLRCRGRSSWLDRAPAKPNSRNRTT